MTEKNEINDEYPDNRSTKFSITLKSNEIIIGSSIIMNKCVWLWIGNSGDLSFGSLNATMPSRFDEIPLATTLIQSNDENSDNIVRMSQRLSKRFNMQFFVSCNASGEKISEIEPKLVEILNDSLINSKTTTIL